jgi:hypothetical protein
MPNTSPSTVSGKSARLGSSSAGRRGDAQAGAAQRIADVGVRVVERALDDGDDEAEHHASADREAKDRRRLVAVNLGLVQVDQVQDGNKEDRDEDRGRDQAGDRQDEDAGQADDEGPAELVNLLVAEVREKGGEDRRLHDMLVWMSGISVPAGLRVADLPSRSLVRSAAGAEDAVGNVIGAVVAAHGR